MSQVRPVTALPPFVQLEARFGHPISRIGREGARCSGRSVVYSHYAKRGKMSGKSKASVGFSRRQFLAVSGAAAASAALSACTSSARTARRLLPRAYPHRTAARRLRADVCFRHRRGLRIAGDPGRKGRPAVSPPDRAGPDRRDAGHRRRRYAGSLPLPGPSCR